ncbi:MAG: hypothetical protein WDM90_11220 [Ferruginibacter sp.]
MANELVAFEDTVKSNYSRIKNQGLDLISILMEKIENENLVKRSRVITDDVGTTIINYENHIYIFTDGYLEYVLSSKQPSSQFYFSRKKIEAIRKYCQINHMDPTTALKVDKTLRLPAYRNNKNQYINLHICETLERDKDVKLLTYSNDMGLRDNEILEAVWQNWAAESGFKSFQWKKY